MSQPARLSRIAKDRIMYGDMPIDLKGLVVRVSNIKGGRCQFSFEYVCPKGETLVHVADGIECGVGDTVTLLDVELCIGFTVSGDQQAFVDELASGRQKPLSEEWIKQAVADGWIDPKNRGFMVDFLRHAERAHGIKEG